MLRKILSVVIACVMVMLSIPVPTYEIEQATISKASNGVISYEDEGTLVTCIDIEGSVIRCEYISDTEEYYLYRDDMQYQLQVEVYDDYALVDIIDDFDYEDSLVYGQAVVALPFAYWTAEAIAAAKSVICSMIGITLTTTAYISVDSIATTIKGVKNGSIAKSKARTIVGVTSYWKLRYCREKQENNYYPAMLKNGKVYIGALISYGIAKRRLQSGYDIYATNSIAAQYLASTSSPARTCNSHPAHQSGDGYYPHYHPVGIRWYRNRNHNPHVWYPYV